MGGALSSEKPFSIKFKNYAAGKLVLARASISGDLLRVAAAVQAYPKLVNEGLSKAGKTAMMMASRAGHLTVVQFLAHQGADLEAIDKLGGTALMHASIFNRLPIVQFLVEKGASMDRKDTHGWTALMKASRIGALPVMQYLINKGAAINIADNDGWTALMWCLKSDEMIPVKFLVESAANIAHENMLGQTAIHLADRSEIREYLDAAYELEINLISPKFLRNVPPEVIAAGCKKVLEYIIWKYGEQPQPTTADHDM
eukprot:GILJ01003327.1.p1 GENE.GILJ01003327.1~~GILJ01003327.1.p1  ORF type:complete len:257 (-),score=30.58 GILJ01003327.1:188-958(-)